MSKVNSSRREPRTSTCTKFSLFFINVLFWLVGSIVLAFGTFVLVETKEFYQQLADLTFQPAILFFVVGFLIFIITFIGCIGALRENTCLLATYTIILTLLLLIMVIGATLGYLFSGKVESKITASLKNTVVFYRDPKRQDLQNLIDSTQIEFKCCGVESYNDWDRNIYFNCSAEVKTPETCGVPYSCCLAELQTNRQCGYGIREPGKTVAERRNTIYTVGCVEQGRLWFSTNMILIGTVCLAILFLQLISIFLANKLRGEVNEIKELRA